MKDGREKLKTQTNQRIDRISGATTWVDARHDYHHRLVQVERIDLAGLKNQLDSLESWISKKKSGLG